jgi:hypothetical protein
MSVSALLAGAYTTTLLVMVKGGGRAPPAFARLGRSYRHDGMKARKWPLPIRQSICTLSSVLVSVLTCIYEILFFAFCAFCCAYSYSSSYSAYTIAFLPSQ